MKTNVYVPNSMRDAGQQLQFALVRPLHQVPKRDFLRAWCSVGYLFPGLHPDGFDDADSGWPRVLKRFAAEAWRREDAGELADEELYPCDAQWSGIYDRMLVHPPDETERRVELAAKFGSFADA
jgi:hypothetical protein